jgi:hypothetical protein
LIKVYNKKKLERKKPGEENYGLLDQIMETEAEDEEL